MTSIDRSVILNRILPFIVLKVWFFSTTTGKDFCDCIISSMKGAIRRCCNEGCKILTAAGMHEALKVRQVKGSSAAVCEIDSGKKETKTKRINNFSFFHNFVYGKNGLHLSKAYGVGMGTSIPWSGLCHSTRNHKTESKPRPKVQL